MINKALIIKFDKTWENVPSDMCAQWRLRSACTSQSLIMYEETLHPWPSEMCPVKILIRLANVQADLNLCCAHVRIYVFWSYGSNIDYHFLVWQSRLALTLSTLSKIFSRRHFEIFFLFLPENRFSHFMQTVSNGDSLHELSKPVLWEKLEK